MDKLFDVIIVNYNCTKHTEHNLEALLKSDWNAYLNIMVQDNASNEDVMVLKQRFAKIHLSRNQKNIGFGAAINRAILHSRAPYVVLINPDAYVESGFFKKILTYLQTYPSVGILGPKVLNYDGTVQGSARAFPNLLTAFFGRNSYLTKMFPNNPISRANILNLNHPKDRSIEVDWVSGACMVIRREALTRTGHLDERFFMYWEDADLCRRMWENGWKVVYYPKAVVHHQVGQSSRTHPYLTIMHFHKSAFKLFVKYSKGYQAFFCPFVASLLMIRGISVAFLTLIKTEH
jgi:GT2 family glycosyltransferase